MPLSQNSVMFDSESPRQPSSDPAVRKLKIEADGDPWKGLIIPKIRLMGRWLERAGFRPGSHVHVQCVAPGIIQLQASEPTQSASEKS
jgi:type I toxin-antitoxin system toxin SymE